MTGDEIGFSEISDVYRNERRSKILSRLPVNFYLRAEEHLQKLREEHCTAILIPNNPSSMMLWDQISKLEKRLKHIYEIRERKITLAALDNLVGAAPPDNMTRRDMALFEQLVGTLTTFRNHSESQECPPPVKVQEPEQEKFTQPKLIEPEPAIEAASPEPTETIIVHVLEDIPPFEGLNNTYDLKKDDMVTLPSQFASLLSSKGKVRIVSG